MAVRQTLRFIAVVAAAGTVAGTVAGTPARAQQVRGVVAAGERPVPGAVVLLVDSADRIVARTVTRDDGRYALVAPAAGRYVLRTLRIGFAPTVSPLSLSAHEVVTRHVQASERRVHLAAIHVRGEQRCRVRPDSGSAAFAVWEEARKALLATQITGASPLRMTVRLAERTLDPDGRELDAVMRADSGRAVQPFVSLPPDSLAAAGYVVLDASGYTAWAPDPDVLLSESFASGHCLRLTAPARGADSSVIGIAFEPARGARRSDVRGTLWLDRTTAELRSLEFRYANTTLAIEDAGAGGRAEFRRLPDGRWVIDRWLIRAPVVETTRTPGRQTDWRVTAVREFGGDVVEVRDGRASLWARGRVPAAARVVAFGRPLAGARVTLDAGRDTIATDSAGVAPLGMLLPGGVHRVSVRPPFGRRDLEPTDARLTIDTSGAPSVVEMTTTAELIRRRCGPVRGAFLAGVVRYMGPEGAAMSDAVVDVTWLADVQRVAGPELSFVGRTETRRTRTDAVGRFTVCDVPYETALRVSARHGILASPTVRVLVQTGALREETALFVRP